MSSSGCESVIPPNCFHSVTHHVGMVLAAFRGVRLERRYKRSDPIAAAEEERSWVLGSASKIGERTGIP